MRLLAIDPSSSCTGYALATGPQVGDLVEAGLIKPSLAWGAMGELPQWLEMHLRDPALTAMRRVLSIAREAEQLARQLEPDQILVEIPSGKVGTGARRGASGSLTTYGMAAGVVLGRLHACMPGRVVPVTERQWTRWRGSKLHHQKRIALAYRGVYKIEQDPQADLADAIGLSRWWFVAGQKQGGGEGGEQ